MRDRTLILGIESAVAGGSLSVLRCEDEIAAWQGEEEPLRAEDILIRIQDLLRAAEVTRSDLTGIAVSAGPGSFTGIRVGLATAGGLARSLGISFSSSSVLEAMALPRSLTGIAAIPMGRGAAGAQRFDNGRALGDPFNVSTENLFAEAVDAFLLHPDLEALAPRSNSRIAVFRDSLAAAIARMSLQGPSSSASPIFLSRT
jgi:tRNA threonylcarbamoyl adenosine modification protein YeaZ